MKYRGKFPQQHPVSYFLVVFFVGVLLMNIPLGESLVESALEAVLLSLLIICSLFFFEKAYLKLPDYQQLRTIIGKALYLLLVAFISGAMLYLFLQEEFEVYTNGWLGSLLFFVVLCLGTGLFEEGLFRGLLFRMLDQGFAGKKNSQLRAALISSFLFGLLHVSSSITSANLSDLVVVGQLFLKIVQASLFGFCMAALFARTKNIWLIAGIHGLNNLLMMAPSVFFVGALPVSYLSGSASDLLILAMTVLLYVPLTVRAVGLLKVVE